ncbi:MAG: hypothetical protein AABZ61_01630 [Bacteroidota bacterium]
MDEEEALVVVYSGSFERALVIRGLLEAYGVKASLKDVAWGIEAPSYLEQAGGSRTFRVLVRYEDSEAARSIIEAPPERTTDSNDAANEPF